jgi:hypothetical protein
MNKEVLTGAEYGRERVKNVFIGRYPINNKHSVSAEDCCLLGCEKSVNIYQAARSHTPEDVSLHSHNCDNLKCRMLFSVDDDDNMILLYNQIMTSGTKISYPSFTHYILLEVNFQIMCEQL